MRKFALVWWVPFTKSSSDDTSDMRLFPVSPTTLTKTLILLLRYPAIAQTFVDRVECIARCTSAFTPVASLAEVS
ncbi:hypothetical protein BU23DRAFT_555218 [Bimuria novae-zelandiae CBS 107.79]|uniref:Uncharacterized protein n=1 Tax=Bimuria novae-zelandiae CBS 107.79 TaxID=1447943 RepID=A0A6A5V8R9_9PLEO|nr:hypothetical protein BU23DRAFT_555218 [Bimuria novae-zelandiae CBS 107.79]